MHLLILHALIDNIAVIFIKNKFYLQMMSTMHSTDFSDYWFQSSYQNSWWNYSLFGFDDNWNQMTNWWDTLVFTPIDDNENSAFVNFSSSAELMHQNRNKSVDKEKPSFPSSSSMLKAKESGRVFYPSKVRHSRHNSHSDPVSKLQRSDGSPLFRSQDSTTDNSSLSSSNEDSDQKSESAKNQERKMSDVAPIQLNLDDEPILLVKSLLLEIVSNEKGVKYELEEADLIRVFEKFGPVKSVCLSDQSSKASIIMEWQNDFTKAQQYLNNYILPNSNAYLLVQKEMESVMNSQESPISNYKPACSKLETFAEIQTTINKNYQGNEVHNKISENEVSKSEVEPQVVSTSEKPTEYDIKVGVNRDCSSVSKFTCKYEIPIKNLPGFSVARKIIGHRGKNMKYILEQLKNNCFGGPIQDVIKLRLRGQGSGFKEGPNNCESPEPLHLCVSSKYHEKYVEACKLVENLLKDVFCEYNNFCRYKGKPLQTYRISKMENNPASFLSNY